MAVSLSRPTRDYQLGDSVYVLLSLPDDPQRYPVATKVVWVTPAKAAGGRVQGVGIRFPKDEKSLALKAKIEAASALTSALTGPHKPFESTAVGLQRFFGLACLQILTATLISPN